MPLKRPAQDLKYVCSQHSCTFSL